MIVDLPRVIIEVCRQSVSGRTRLSSGVRKPQSDRSLRSLRRSVFQVSILTPLQSRPDLGKHVSPRNAFGGKLAVAISHKTGTAEVPPPKKCLRLPVRCSVDSQPNSRSHRLSSTDLLRIHTVPARPLTGQCRVRKRLTKTSFSILNI